MDLSGNQVVAGMEGEVRPAVQEAAAERVGVVEEAG